MQLPENQCTLADFQRSRQQVADLNEGVAPHLMLEDDAGPGFVYRPTRSIDVFYIKRVEHPHWEFAYDPDIPGVSPVSALEYAERILYRYLVYNEMLSNVVLLPSVGTYYNVQEEMFYTRNESGEFVDPTVIEDIVEDWWEALSRQDFATLAAARLEDQMYKAPSR